jgi:microcystin-dependent protein
MSRNGSGIYILPTGNPVVTGTTITSNWANTSLSDIATALTGSLAADGQTPVTGNIQMGGNLITGMGAGVSSNDAVTLAQLAAVNSVVTGSIQMWPTVTAPTGYLLCVGTAVSRSTYAALFAIIGTTFGVGDGSTTFNLPNYSDRFPIGSGTIAALAATGGSKDAVVVSHTHTATVTDPQHKHIHGATFQFQGSVYGDVTVASGAQSGQSGGSTLSGYTSTESTGITVANSTTGVSGTNANLPPYLGINFIIKV